MAKKEEKTIKLERVYNIPLRKDFLKVPLYKRTKRAISSLRDFVKRHMKAEDVKIGKYLNLELWKHGIKNPPHHVKVKCSKDDKGVVIAELEGAPAEKKEETKKRKKPAKIEETPEKKAEEKLEETKKEKQEEAKEIQKEELKELKKEHPKQHAQRTALEPKSVFKHPTAPKQQ